MSGNQLQRVKGHYDAKGSRLKRTDVSECTEPVKREVPIKLLWVDRMR